MRSDISANYRSQLTASQAGLVANWKFDEAGGNLASDSAGTHTATLGGGAVFAIDVHP